jgi:hypothetical protein
MSAPTPAVEPNLEVILFEHPEFRGAHRHIFQRENDLSVTDKPNPTGVNAAGGNFGGKTSSIIVVRGTWLFFAEKNCDLHGDELEPGKYRNFKNIALKDNAILSLKPK